MQLIILIRCVGIKIIYDICINYVYILIHQIKVEILVYRNKFILIFV